MAAQANTRAAAADAQGLKSISDSAAEGDGLSGPTKSSIAGDSGTLAAADGRQATGNGSITPQGPLRVRLHQSGLGLLVIPQRDPREQALRNQPTHRMHPTHAMGLQVGAHTMQLASQRMARSRRAARLRVEQRVSAVRSWTLAPRAGVSAVLREARSVVSSEGPEM